MSDFLTTAVAAVKAAEKEILKQYRDNVHFELKPDLTPVTKADSEAQKIIIETIRQKYPDHDFLGEEEIGTQRHTSAYTWVIDPIDGTKNFIRGIPLFATQLALMHKNEIIVGVSNAPVLKETLTAEKGSGSFLNGKQVAVSGISRIEEAFMSYGSIHYFQNIGKFDALMKLSRVTHGHKGFGDCWSYHLLSEGKVDLVLEGKIRIWDVAAAAIIVEEAGGKMTDLEGKKIGLETTTALSSNGILHPAVLKYLQNQ